MLKHLTIEEMVALLSPWVGKTKRRATFLSIPEIAPLHPLVHEAYQGVLAVRAAESAPPPALRKLTEKGASVDYRHDNLARAAYFQIQAERAQCLAAEPADADRAAECDRLLLRIFPDGLAFLNTSYLAESGNTARIARLLEDEPELAAFLKSIPVRSKKTLADTVSAWLSTGRELESIEHEREELLARQVSSATIATIQAARSRWFRVVSAVLGNLELSSAPAEAIESIRGPVLRASDRASKRYATGKLEEPVLDPDTDPGPGDTPTEPEPTGG